jgi:hypothetical protein
MSELALRDFPPVDPVDPPSRLSMTLLRLYNNCNRAAYLYRKYKGGPASHEMNRGTVAHVAFERMLSAIKGQGAYLDEKGHRQYGRIPMDVAKDIMAEAIANTPITVPAEQQANLRVMAAHFAEGVHVDPDHIVGVEQKIVLPIDDLVVVGKLDLVLRDPESGVLEVWDWKTAMAMTAVDEIAEKLRDGRLAPKSFQLLVYILLAAFGIPVETCPKCGGTGELVYVTMSPDAPTLRVLPGDTPPPDPDGTKLTVDECDECVRGDLPMENVPLGHGINLFRAFEMYPMFLFDAPRGGGRELGRRGPLDVTRPELIDHQAMLEGLVYKAAAAFGLVDIPGIEAWRFEAVPGTHCKQCPARGECPIPGHLRSWAGEINEREQAEEAIALLEHEKAQHAARQREIRLWAKANGVPLRVGSDEAYVFEEQTAYKTDWGGLEAAVERAATFGEVFDLEAHR